MEKETKVDIIHENVSKEDKDLKDLAAYLPNKQNEILAKLKELETENLRLREVLERYENVNMTLSKENEDLKYQLDKDRIIQDRYEREIEDCWYLFIYSLYLRDL